MNEFFKGLEKLPISKNDDGSGNEFSDDVLIDLSNGKREEFQIGYFLFTVNDDDTIDYNNGEWMLYRDGVVIPHSDVADEIEWCKLPYAKYNDQ